MSKTISAAYTVSGYTLASGSQAALNPVTVTGSIDIGTGTIPAALYALGPTAWTVTNLGSITGRSVAGVELLAGGTIVNGGLALLSGHYGVAVHGGAGAVVNHGTILATSAGTTAAASVAVGVLLSAGGGVSNQPNGNINATGWGVAIEGGVGTVINGGIIGGTSRDGVYLSTGTVTNQSYGIITGSYGIVIKTSGDVSNAGTVTGGSGQTQDGVYLDTGSVTNQGTGVIAGGWGIYIEGTGTVSNAGGVSGTDQAGVFLRGGLVTNNGTISGAWGVAAETGTATVVNTGVLNGTAQSGVYLAGGLVSNASGGLINGLSGAVIKNAAGTVANSGSIAATSTSGYSVYLASGFANRVIDNPGAVFTGSVNGGNTAGSTATSTLELGAAPLQGTLSGLGTQFINFGQVTIDPGANWSLTGANSLATGGTLLDQGDLTLNGAELFDGASSTISATTSTMADLTVTGGGGVWSGTAPLVVGATGNGRLVVSNQGSVSILATATQAALALGVVAGADGSVEVTGLGTKLRAIGELTVGQAGQGQLWIGSQATVSTGGDGNLPSQGVDIGQAASGSGAITVSGTNSLLTNTGEFIVGDSGQGGLSVQAGGTVITTPGTVTALAGLVIASTADAAGSLVNVSGAGSDLTVTGPLDVGVSGSGALSISDGATVAAGSLDAGVSAAAVANISVTDASLTVTGDATVADDGTGVLSVLSGATVSAANLTIGSQADSSGAVVVSGVGSVINIAGNLNVGTSLGTGDLTIGPGGVVNAKVVSLQGQVVLENGELDPTVNLINQGQTAGGSGTIAAGDIVDEGVIQAGGSKPSQKLLVVNGTVLGGGPWTINGTSQAQANGGAGILQINAGGTLELNGAVVNAASTTFTDDVTPQSTYTVTNSVVDVNFADATGVLKLDQVAGFAGTIAAFQKGDSFVITGGTLSGLGVSNGNTLTVSDSGHGGTDSLIFASGVSAAGFSIVNNNTIQVACFAAGTRIGVEKGCVPVEDLVVGDRVVTADGRVEPIVWIGQRTVNCGRHPLPQTVCPVLVSAGAFGENGPMRDLYLSPDHAVFVNDVLIPVKLLINGTSIVQVQRPTVMYYHVELPRHEVIHAEGLTVETYLDLGDRANFLGGDVIRLVPDLGARLALETALLWETLGAARLVTTGPELISARNTVASHQDRQRHFPGANSAVAPHLDRASLPAV